MSNSTSSNRKIANHERVMVKFVHEGDLEIDNDGKVWRSSVTNGLKNGGSSRYPVERRRAEKLDGRRRYLVIIVIRAGKAVKAQAHRLVWQYFFGNIPDGKLIHHKNGCKTDNRPENLEVTDASGNMKRACEMGAIKNSGESNPNVMLSDKEVWSMRSLYSDGKHTQTQVAAMYHVTLSTVSGIVRGKTRQFAGGPTDSRDHRADWRSRLDEQGRVR